jgi:hypothetical protein
MGFVLEQVIALATSAPADSIDRVDRLGTSQTGAT